MKNAKQLGYAEVEDAAFRRLCMVLSRQFTPEAEPGPVVFSIWRSIFALEEMLTSERGKTTRLSRTLSRTRQLIRVKGEVAAVAQLCLKPKPSDGFHMLVERGFPDLLFEYVVLTHTANFPTEVAEAARQRLENHSLFPELTEL